MYAIKKKQYYKSVFFVRAAGGTQRLTTEYLSRGFVQRGFSSTRKTHDLIVN